MRDSTVWGVLWANTCPCSLTGAWTILHFIAPCAKAPASVSNRGHEAISQDKADSVTAPLNSLSSLFYPLLALIFTTETLHPHVRAGWMQSFFVCMWVTGSVIYPLICAENENILRNNGMDLSFSLCFTGLPCVSQVHTRQCEKKKKRCPLPLEM